jgi:hypothetical protein
VQEARGGEVVVREGLLVQPPTITSQPADAAVNEGETVQLTVKAVVSAAVATVHLSFLLCALTKQTLPHVWRLCCRCSSCDNQACPET